MVDYVPALMQRGDAGGGGGSRSATTSARLHVDTHPGSYWKYVDILCSLAFRVPRTHPAFTMVHTPAWHCWTVTAVATLYDPKLAAEQVFT
jgi:hypothetical protein